MPNPEDAGLDIVKKELEYLRNGGLDNDKYASRRNIEGALLRFIDTLIVEIEELKDKVSEQASIIDNIPDAYKHKGY